MRIIALSFAVLSPVYALTINEAVDFTLKNSPDLEINLQKRDIAKAELSKSYGQFFPKVSLSGEFSDQSFTQNTQDQNLPDFNYWHKEYDIELSQNLFDGLSRYNQIQQSKQELRSQQYVYHNSIYDLTLEIAKLTFEIQHAQKVIDMAKDNFNKINEIKELIAKRVKEGVSKDIDLVQAKGRLSVAKTNILESVRELRNLKSQYTQLTGGLPGDDLTPPRVTTLNFTSFDDLWQLVQEKGASLKPYYALQKSSLYNYQAQKGSHLPTLDFYAKYKYDKGIAENPSTSQRTRNIGLRAQWVLFEGGKQSFDTYIHAQKYQQARLEVKKQLQAVRFKTERAFENYSILTDSLPFLKDHTQAALKTTKSYFDQFLLGQKSLLDLLDSHNELLRARKNEQYNQMLLTHNRLEISHLTGNLLKDLGVTSANKVIMNEKELGKLEASFGIMKG